ncbi:hypothetical protein CHS0354_031211 [Potamilus streckersoni]|uniref:Chitin-binding type-2 domain-containing protein n=1 Tax=Potamilus streckersoni TaxID=2493646 RepID=A0AAE0WGS9_9BIVA|nr:hypothetical protein CHS0354_031211 [Potamilus streckersoni]
MTNNAPTAPAISFNPVNSVTATAASTPSTPITECVQVPGGCQNLPNGDYQSCTSCNHYITCNFGIAIERPCQLPSLFWDDMVKECLFKSPTCP